MGNICGRQDGQPDTTSLSIGRNYRELTNQYSGLGVKRTTAWEADITRLELTQERERFWASRMEGSRSVWLLLRQALEADHLSAAMILQTGHVAAQNGSMAVCVDSRGNRYELPPFVLTDPMQFAEDKETMSRKAGNNKPEPVKSIEVKLRSMTTQKDIVLSVRNDQTVGDVKALLPEKGAGCRLFFGGKQMKDEEQLLEYRIRSGMVVQMLEGK
jgi:hypothetical protein